MLHRIIVFFLLSLFLFNGKINAQKLLTLEEAIATALQNNYNIQLAKNDSIIAAIDYSYRNTVFLPTLNASASTLWNTNNQDLKFVKRSGGGDSAVSRDAVRTNNISASVNLNWVLFDGLRMFAIRDRAEELVKLGSLTIKEQVINTIALVVTTYYDVVRQKQQLKSVDEQIALNEERVKLAQYKLDIGTGAKPDLLQSKVDLNAQRSLRMLQETQIEQLKEQLIQAMNVVNTVIFDVSDSIPLNKNIVLADIQTDIDKTNPALLIAQKNIDISRLILKERKGELLPTISFNSAYNFTRNDNNVAVNFNQPFFTQNRGYNYGFTASIPIFNRFNTRRLIKQAELDIRFGELTLLNQRSLVTLDVINAFKNYELYKKVLDLEEENILLARENVDIIFKTYRLGAATLVQLREAQSSLELANFRLIGARYNAKLAEIDLLRLKGELVR